MQMHYEKMKYDDNRQKTHFFCQICVTTFFVLIEIGPPVTQNFCYGSIKTFVLKSMSKKSTNKIINYERFRVTVNISECRLTHTLTDFPNLDSGRVRCHDAVCKKSKTHSSDDVHDDRAAMVSLHHFCHCTNSFVANARWRS